MHLAELADIQMGFTFRARVEPDANGAVAIVQMKDIDEANVLNLESAIRVSLPEGKEHHLLQPGDLLFRSRGRSNGATTVPCSIGKAILAAPMLLIRPRAVNPDYLCWFINAAATQTLLAGMAEGTSAKMISTETLKSLDVPLPTVAAQQRIAEVAALAAHEARLMARIASARLRLTTQLLMQHAQNISQEPRQ